jgi:hypothetical protein
VTTKTCSRCREDKPVSRFPIRRDAPDGLHYWCIPCKREKDREYSARYASANPERKRAHGTAWQRRNRTAASEAARRYKYGLSSAEIAALIETQGGACALCRLTLGDAFHVDHDHACCPGSKTCGECIRGVLCRRCNIGLGQFNDDPDLLAAAAAYSLSLRNVLPPVGQPN